jgi:DNA-binding response OmpR family regulator
MQGKARVLVVDSEADFLRAARKALDASFEVASTTSASEGLGRASRERPDVIVLGHLEPRGTSFAVHNELRNSPATKDIPLLVVDVRPKDHSRKGWTRREGLRMNAEDYTSRPVEPEELADALTRIIRRTSGEPIGLREASEHMERTLERINRIEQLLVG